MKKLWSLILAAALTLSLSACGGEKAPFDPWETTAALLKTQGVFSEELERLDTAIAVQQYALGSYLSLEQSKYAGHLPEPTAQYGRGGREDLAVVAYRSTGATAEEVAVIRFGSEEDAKDYESKAESYLEEQREANVDYRPQEMPKLENAVVERRGATILILVAADYQAADPILG